MSLNRKRSLIDLTNDDNNNSKRLKNDSAIDLNFDIGELKNEKSFNSYSTSSESLIIDDSILDDEVFHDEQSGMTSTKQNKGRKRLNGTSTYRIKENPNKRQSKSLKSNENLLIDQTLNQLREEQARIDAHLLSMNKK